MRRTVFVLDLDGTLVDSVYQHVLAWQEALEAGGIELSVWRIHRRIGMSGGLFVGALLRETGQPVDAELVARLQQVHAQAYRRRTTDLRLLPGSKELLARLTGAGVPWAIATSGLIEAARPTLELLGVPPEVPVVTRDQVAHAKPDPDLFLAAAERLGADLTDAVVVGDSVWDLLAARRAGALGIGLLSGGYGREELSGPAPTGSTRTRPTCSCTWTRSGSGSPTTPDRLGAPYLVARTVGRSGPSSEGGSLVRRAHRGGADGMAALARHPRRHRARRAGGAAVRHQCVQQLRRGIRLDRRFVLGRAGPAVTRAQRTRLPQQVGAGTVAEPERRQPGRLAPSNLTGSARPEPRPGAPPWWGPCGHPGPEFPDRLPSRLGPRSGGSGYVTPTGAGSGAGGPAPRPGRPGRRPRPGPGGPAAQGRGLARA